MRDAWVENVHVQRVFPNTLNLAVTERTIGATVEIGVDDGESTETWALSTDGIWLCRIPDKDSEAAQNISPKIYEDAESVFVITDVTYGVKPEVGKVCTDESVKNALDVVTSLSTDLKESGEASFGDVDREHDAHAAELGCRESRLARRAMCAIRNASSSKFLPTIQAR